MAAVTDFYQPVKIPYVSLHETRRETHRSATITKPLHMIGNDQSFITLFQICQENLQKTACAESVKLAGC